MADWLSLAEVAARPGLAGRAVALRGGEPIRRAQFLADVQAWCAGFAALRGARVALYFDDSYDFAAALYGAWHAGKQVFLPGDAQPATLQRLLPEVDGCAGALPGALRPVAGAKPALAPLDPRTTGLCVYTSGSSGEPLAIHKRLDQLDAEIHHQQLVFGERVDTGGPARVYGTVSHQHIYGLLFCTLWPLAAGRPFVAERLVYPEEMAARLAEGGCILVSSPAHLRRLPEALDWQPARSRLRAVYSSGGPLPPEAAQASLELLGQSPIEVFGSSETGGIAWRQRAVQGERWTLLPGVEWRIDDGDLLAVRSAHLPGADWWVSADRVRALPASEGGGFAMLGRADRIAKIEEKRVSLTAVEAALAACSEVEEARVLVLGHEGSQRLAAAVVPSQSGWALLQRDGKRALNERLRAVLLQTVERVALPRSWRYLHALPVNAQGKSTESLLSALFRPMMPKVTWRSREAQDAQAELDIVPELLVFDGHFPDAAVLPGVAQLDWAVTLARECFALPPGFQRIEALKFRRQVAPGTRLLLELQWHEAERVLVFAYHSGGEMHASGRIVFGGPA